MPVNVVHNEREEIAWERAKATARKQYPDLTGPRFYKIVMTIYKRMIGSDSMRRNRRAS